MSYNRTKDSVKAPPDPADVSHGFVIKLIGCTTMTLLMAMVLLALVSYDPEDTHYLNGGLGEHAMIRNWIGLFGAHISRQLFLWLGLSAYAGVTLILICLINRIFSRDVKPIGKVYIAGIIVTIWGTSMLMGSFPQFLENVAYDLNMARTPGGVIGQRFCAPWSIGVSGGWLAYVVNPTGSILISSAMVVVGLVTIWHYDWQARSIRWWRSLISSFRNFKTDHVTAAKLKQALVDKLGTAKPGKPLRDERRGDAGANPISQSPAPSPSSIPDPAPSTVKPAERTAVKLPHSSKNYKLPGVQLLNRSSPASVKFNPAEIEAKKEILQETLDSFSIDAMVGESTSGPRVTLFEIRPAPGVKVERISSLANNISMNLKAESLRILTPIPGKDTVGIEVPNRTSAALPFRELLESRLWTNTKATIPLALGKDIAGNPVILNLADAPHLLIAGATGSGKSVCMNTIIMSLLFRFSPEQLKLIMVDPKVVEFSGYNSLPHLVTPVVTQVKKVPIVLRWVLNQMEWRYDILSKVGVRNLAAFNSRKKDREPVFDENGLPIPEKLPFLIVVIDELADIMMTAKADVETSLARIAQLARAVGIHAIVATQRPSVNVITGIIKANFPTRIAFQVTSVVDSRTILDGKGAESLLGRGDMLFKAPGGSKLERTQGAMVEDDEIHKVVSCVSDQAQPEFIEDILSFGAAKSDNQNAMASVASTGIAPITPAMTQTSDSMDGDNELVQKAIEVILKDRRATTSHIQRRLRIGYNRAALVIEELERRGIIGAQVGTAPRQILIDEVESAEDDDDLG